MKSVFLSAGHSNTAPGAVAHGRGEAERSIPDPRYNTATHPHI